MRRSNTLPGWGPCQDADALSRTDVHRGVMNGARRAHAHGMIAPMDGSVRTAEAAISGREYYRVRGVDVLAIVSFWALLAVVSAVSRELDPRIPGLPPRMVSAVVMATYVEYALWALLTVPIWWIASRYAIERGRRVGRVLMFVVVGVVLAVAVPMISLVWPAGG